MAVYVTNVNGDWWQFSEGQPLFVLDTDELPEQLLDEIADNIGEDKFENVIMEYGRQVSHWL